MRFSDFSCSFFKSITRILWSNMSEPSAISLPVTLSGCSSSSLPVTLPGCSSSSLPVTLSGCSSSSLPVTLSGCCFNPVFFSYNCNASVTAFTTVFSMLVIIFVLSLPVMLSRCCLSSLPVMLSGCCFSSLPVMLSGCCLFTTSCFLQYSLRRWHISKTVSDISKICFTSSNGISD